MKTLIYYEKRKILRRKSTIIACLLMLLSIIALSFVFVSDQDYYRTDGTEVSGMEAIHVKQEMDHALAGPLTAKRLKDTLQQYHTVYGNSDNFGASGALKDEVYCKDILPYNGILNLMRRIYSPAGAYDMNILSSVTNERVENFYQDRHAQVQSIVDMDYTTGNYTQAEKDTILKLDTKVSDPITYDYSDGWKTLLTRDFPTVFLLIALVVCIIISPVFAYEYQTGADAVVLSSKYGRRETVWAKLIAGFTVTSRIYFIAVLVSLISVLAVFGVQGWNCDFQILSTTAYYGMKIWQVVFVGIVINYVVVLSVMAFTLLLSAACKTPFAAVLISTLCTIVPMFLPTSRVNGVFNKLLCLLPAKACGVLNVCSVQLRQACHNSSLHDSNCSMCCDYRCASHSAQKILQASGGMMLADLRRNAKNRRTGCDSRPPVFAYGSQSAFSSSTRSMSLRPLNVHGATLISLYPSEWYSRRARVLRTFVSIRRYRQPCRAASCS